MGLFKNKWNGYSDEEWEEIKRKAQKYWESHPEEAQARQARQEEKERNKVRCTYCNSTNVKKITATGRMVS
ncbi:MAG: hypothetical protein ACI4PM_01940, partial [Butyricicoccus sp.]